MRKAITMRRWTSTVDDIEVLRKERDAAIADIYNMGGCPNCKFNIGKSETNGLPVCKKKLEYPDGKCFEWRGSHQKNDPPPPRRCGEWIHTSDWPQCSNCGADAEVDRFEYDSRDKIRPATTDYCPSCGAEMKGGATNG